MIRRPLGQSGIQASVIAFGAWAVGGWRWGGADEKESVAAIRAGLDAGIDLIDTAPVYGLGRGEEIVGKAIEGRRDKVVIATKCGIVWHVERGQLLFVADEHGRNENGAYRLHKYLGVDEIRADFERSLRRLRTDYVDLYQTHWQDPTTPVADVMACLLDLKRQGRIRAIGVCNATVENIEEYRRFGAVDADQERYSMLDRKLEPRQLPHCRSNGIAALAYSPMEHGLLTGKVTSDRVFNRGDLRQGHPGFTPERLARVRGLLDRLEPIARGHGLSLGQLALAWAVAPGGCTHALAGARTAKQAEENAAAGRAELPSSDRAEIDRLLADFASGGA
jgi:aryl-alcohol dehydrogenase-like predicted oxidoreductase